MEPVFFYVQGRRFGQVERWPLHDTRESAEGDRDRIKRVMSGVGITDWVFTVEETKTDA